MVFINMFSSSTSSSSVSEVAAALRRRQKKPHALRMPQKKRGLNSLDTLLLFDKSQMHKNTINTLFLYDESE